MKTGIKYNLADLQIIYRAFRGNMRKVEEHINKFNTIEEAVENVNIRRRRRNRRPFSRKVQHDSRRGGKGRKS